jgi:hypothetical protein
VTVFLGLQILMITDITLPQLLEQFYNTDDDLLLQFRKLCSNAKLYDVLYLIDYLLAAKRDNMPLGLIVSSCPQPIDNIADWVQTFKDKLDGYSSRVMSIKTLVDGVHLKHQCLEDRLTALSKLLLEQMVSPESEAVVEVMCSYQDLLTTNEHADYHRDIMITFDELLRSTKLNIAYDIIAKLPADLLTVILKRCLAAPTYGDDIHKGACKNLLSLICQSNNQLNANNLTLIKTQLGRQDFSVMGEVSLKRIAAQILDEQESTLEGCTFNGVWIQRLLTSPRFIAAANPEALQALIERYRLISLTLKQAEFDELNGWLSANMDFTADYSKIIDTIEKELNIKHSKKDWLYKKRRELLNFRAEDSIRALLIELEEKCTDLKDEEPTVADSALTVLYTHYNTNLSSLRSDVLFQVTDYLYSAAVRGKGDIILAQSTLSGWLNKYLPHMNFEQRELSRKKSVLVCNKAGKKIGFINESNRVMSLINDEICPMTDVKGAHTGMQFYDEKRCIIGTLSATGEFKRDNIFQKNTSALLVASVPSVDLSRSPAALKLLFDDILSENSLEMLYSSTEVTKHDWIGEQLQSQLTLFKKRLSPESIQAMVKYQSIPALFNLLKTIEFRDNAEQLVKAIIREPTAREALFSAGGESSFFEFLTRHNPSQQFAAFLSENYDKPWFISGLKSFANYAKHHKQPAILTSALTLLNQRCYEHKTLTEQTYDAILQTLLASNESATVIWKNFLNADVLTKVQRVNATLAKQLTEFFFKHHCIPLVETINGQKRWSESYQYKLLLLILSHQRKQIFQQNELRYSEKLAWSPKELSQLCQFVKRHNNLKDSPDINASLGEKLLSELIFRCANFGNTELFYHSNKTFDEKMATHNLKRSYLNATAARSYITQTLNDFITTLKAWLNKSPDNKALASELKDNQAIIDWENISNSTWALSESIDSMPLISAFLINYSGQKAPLARLITDFCNSEQVKKNPELLHNLSIIMLKLPNRDVSACLFHTFEDFIKKNPKCLDKTIFTHMAAYHAKQHVKLKLSPIEEKLHLINHFGLQKSYNVVRQCCKLLVNNSSVDPVNRKLLAKIHVEAKVENKLHKHLGKWYFVLLQFFKRYWNYGVSGVKNPSQSVVFCDTDCNYTSPMSPETIATPVLGGQTIANQIEFHQKSKTLIARYERFLKKPEGDKKLLIKMRHIEQTEISAHNRPFFEREQPNSIDYKSPVAVI